MINEELKGQIQKELRTIEDALQRKNDAMVRKHVRELKQLAEETGKDHWIDLCKSFYEEVFEDDFDYWFVDKLFLKLKAAMVFKEKDASKNKDDLDNLKVLACEHNQINMEFLKILLKKLFVDFEVVDSGKLVLEKLESRSFDMILVDLDLKDTDRLELIQGLKSASIPIIGMTKSEESDFAEMVDGLLMKPVQKDSLIKSINKILGK